MENWRFWELLLNKTLQKMKGVILWNTTLMKLLTEKIIILLNIMNWLDLDLSMGKSLKTSFLCGLRIWILKLLNRLLMHLKKRLSTEFLDMFIVLMNILNLLLTGKRKDLDGSLEKSFWALVSVLCLRLDRW